MTEGRRSPNHDKNRDKGFTLVELMVVVVVLAILMAVGVPTLLGAKAKGQDAAATTALEEAMEVAVVAFGFAVDDATVDATAMANEDNFVTFVAGDAPSTGPTVVSVRATEFDWTGVLLSASGTCFRAHVGANGAVHPTAFATDVCAADNAPYGENSVVPTTVAAVTTASPATVAPTTTTTLPAGGTATQALASAGDNVAFPGAGAAVTINGNIYAAGDFTTAASPSITGNVYAKGYVTVAGASSAIVGNVQSNSDYVSLVSGSTVTGNVYSADTISVGTSITGNAKAASSITGCARVTGSCTQNSNPTKFTVPAAPVFTWNAANYVGETVWQSSSAFQSWLSSHASSLSGVHYVPGTVNINVPVTITGSTVIVSTDTLTVSSSISTNVSGAASALFVSTGAAVSITGSVTGASNVGIAFMSKSDNVTSSGTIDLYGSIAAQSLVSLTGSTSITYKAVNDPGIA
ncbi:MAG: prepilin-type N-terminal cleavage/methylation domain-containing protein [Acidimicrobiia bacterium]